MNALLLLMGLLVLSYIGSFLVGGRALRGVGLPSGSEYVALGFVLGPHVLGIVERSMLESFEPIVQVALGWLALVIGIDYGWAGERRVGPKSLALGLASALITGGAVAAAVMLVLSRVALVPTTMDGWLLAGGLGAVGAETTRHAVRWVTERHQAKGKLSNLLNEMSHADDVVSLVLLAVLFAVTQKPAQVPWHVPLYAWVAATIALGLVLGAVAALLLGGEFKLHTTWGVLFGTSMLAIGTAARLDLASLSVMFFMGVALSAVSPHHVLLREAVAPTERPVLLPALLLAGARIDLNVLRSRYVVIVIVVAIVARVAGKLVSGLLVKVTRAARSASPAIGLALLSSGALSIAIGLAFALRFPGVVGDTVLLAAAFAAIFGEFVAPATLRRVLAGVGEVPEPIPESTRIATPTATTAAPTTTEGS
jgi:Sodium/hydrogen exchanger family